MNIFEIMMLLCFGASWPFAVYKTWKTRSTQGKSFRFLLLVFIGYLSGIFFKLTTHPDPVIGLYIINNLFVAADIILHIRYRWFRGTATLTPASKL